MKRTVKFIPLLLVMFTASSCRLVYAKASTSAIGKSGVGGNEESLYSKSPRPYNGLDLFVPIDKSYQFKDTLEDQLEFPGVEDIDFETARGIVDSDYVARSRNEPLPKFTRVATMKEELHINEKHDDLEFSPMDIYIERQHIMKIHSDLLWLYSRDVENFRTVYFGGEESIQHVVGDHEHPVAVVLCHVEGDVLGLPPHPVCRGLYRLCLARDGPSEDYPGGDREDEAQILDSINNCYICTTTANN